MYFYAYSNNTYDKICKKIDDIIIDVYNNDPINMINATPLVTAPGMISTTDKGVVFAPSLRYLSNL